MRVTTPLMVGFALLAGFTRLDATPQPRVFAKGWVATDRLSCEAEEFTPPLEDQFGLRFRLLDEHPFREYAPAGVHTVRCLGPGRYLVRFQNLGVQGGVVHVSANEDTPSHDCKVGLWFPEGSDLLVYVNCFGPDGRAEDSKFYALFYKDTELGSAIDGNAYLWAASPTHAPPAYQFNSRGGINSVRRLARGHYEARLPRMQRHALEPDKGGTVMVTAYGSGPGRCKVRGWIQEGNEIRAQVGCHHPDGGGLDSSFTLSFMRMPGTLAAAVAEDHVEAFYLWANVLPTPSVFYQSDSYGRASATIERAGEGAYRVFLPEVTALKEKTAQVTAYGPGDAHCTLSRIVDHAPLPLTVVDVHCFDRAGSFVDSAFTLYYESGRSILF